MPRISKTPVLFSKPQYANGYLSQWAHSPFEYDGEKYESMEMWMMVHKARLFQDEDLAQKILQELNPKKNRAMGRKVKGFNAEAWDNVKYKVVRDGNALKFTISSNADELRAQLMETGERELVEAAKWDRVWGIGYAKSNALKNRDSWGENLLGKALVEVRGDIGRLGVDKVVQSVTPCAYMLSSSTA